jgi:hypothetical protein
MQRVSRTTGEPVILRECIAELLDLDLLYELGWDGLSDPFEPVTGEDPDVQALLWEDPE